MEHVCLRWYTSFCVIFVPSGERSTGKKLVTSDPCKKYFLKAKKMGFLMIYYTWNSSHRFTIDSLSKSVSFFSSDPLDFILYTFNEVASNPNWIKTELEKKGHKVLKTQNFLFSLSFVAFRKISRSWSED